MIYVLRAPKNAPRSGRYPYFPYGQANVMADADGTASVPAYLAHDMLDAGWTMVDGSTPEIFEPQALRDAPAHELSLFFHARGIPHIGVPEDKLQALAVETYAAEQA